jgi:probable rRNA maturation factor
MAVLLSCENFPLNAAKVNALWQGTIKHRSSTDEDVAVQCVSAEEIQHLNKTYRKHDSVTNVLTFTYEADPAAFPEVQTAEHDIVVCLSVAEKEARERKVQYRDYVALLLVHAFLHVTGMDHERSAKESESTQQAESNILEDAGFSSVSL